MQDLLFLAEHLFVAAIADGDAAICGAGAVAKTVGRGHELTEEKRPRPGAGGRAWPGPKFAERINIGPLALHVGELGGDTFALSHIIGPISLSRFDPVPGLVRSRQRFVLLSQPLWDSINGSSNAARKGANDGYDKFSLPTGSGFAENILKVRARGLVSDAEFGLGGPKCLSCNEMKR